MIQWRNKALIKLSRSQHWKPEIRPAESSQAPAAFLIHLKAPVFVLVVHLTNLKIIKFKRL